MKKPELLLIILAAVLFTAGRLCYYLAGHPELFTTLSKIAMSAVIVCLSIYMYTHNKSQLNLFILIEMLVCCVGDILINFSFPVGILVFGIGHIIFIIGNLKVRPQKKLYQLIILLAVAIASAVVIIIIHEKIGWGLAAAVFVYIIIIMCAVVLALPRCKLLRFGYILFAVSDLLLIAKATIFKGNVLAEVIALVVYYAAIIMIIHSMVNNKK